MKIVYWQFGKYLPCLLLTGSGILFQMIAWAVFPPICLERTRGGRERRAGGERDTLNSRPGNISDDEEVSCGGVKVLVCCAPSTVV